MGGSVLFEQSSGFYRFRRHPEGPRFLQRAEGSRKHPAARTNCAIYPMGSLLFVCLITMV